MQVSKMRGASVICKSEQVRLKGLKRYRVVVLKALGRAGIIWSPRKMHVGAGLRSCGDALSTAQICGSDSRLVFLLHNQFAVWIPLHITLNTQSLLDPAKSLFSFLTPPIFIIFYWFTALFHLKMSNLYPFIHLTNPYIQFLLPLHFY